MLTKRWGLAAASEMGRFGPVYAMGGVGRGGVILATAEAYRL